MITAVDTSVLLDVFTADATYGVASLQALRGCLAAGSLIACEVVWAEVVAAFPSPEEAVAALVGAGVAFDPLGRAAALEAGKAWRSYRRHGGTRTRVIADFLIAAHAREAAGRLLTRDRGFFRAHFSGLALIDPSVPTAQPT